jgi:16S rRNA (cytosine967-C5)-methyltransferase
MSCVHFSTIRHVSVELIHYLLQIFVPESFHLGIMYIANTMRHYSYLQSASRILEMYDGKEPFTSYIKKYFSANKKFGSTDRKKITHLCYSYFRTGKMLKKISTEEKILIGLFLTAGQGNEMLIALRPEWSEKLGLRLTEKVDFLNDHISEPVSLFDIFPLNQELSDQIEHDLFCESFLVQPNVFLRLRPGKGDIVRKKLENAGIAFDIHSEDCLGVLNSTKIDTILTLNEEAIVQDYNSQRTALLLPHIENGGHNFKVWDCCAASGGKSIMLHDLYPSIDLSVSDIRESILINLKARFKSAGIRNYKSEVIDLNHPIKNSFPKFDLVIADVPCTGSGTWSRTPEQLYFFDEGKIETYTTLQQKIIGNILPQLKPGGYLLYITCSVFRKENEDAVELIKKNLHLDLLKMEVLKGYDKKADSMFAALLRKPL